ncbi:MAG: hypothetical protein WCD63_08355, partial [Terrimicrobiaceae bacterium]
MHNVESIQEKPDEQTVSDVGGITPWINLDGHVAHPNSPRGGGGPGAFREAGSILRQSLDEFGLPHPRSPQGRRVAIGCVAEPLPHGESGEEKEPAVHLDKEVLEKAGEEKVKKGPLRLAFSILRPSPSANPICRHKKVVQ